MIYTSNYGNIKSDKFKTYSISWDKGKDASYSGDSLVELAPKLSFWREWKKNRGIISEYDNNKFYINSYYNDVLSTLDPGEIYNKLNNSIMLCYEGNMDFCHRHIVAAWLELFLDINVSEVVDVGGKLCIVDKPTYIKEILEECVKKSMEMNGFFSIRAAYLYSMAKKNSNDSFVSDFLLFEASDYEDYYYSKSKVYKK